MTLPVVWMCSGQGSQFFNMGQELYRSEPVFRRAMDLCDEMLRPLLGLRLTDVIYAQRGDPHAPFDRVLHSSPAILAVQYAMARVLRARGQSPDLVLGYSLGEISAGILAGALALEDGLRLAVRMAELLERSAPPGAMLAVLGDRALMAAHPEWFAEAEVAGRNFDGHFVLSGRPEVMARVEAKLGAAGVSVQRLPVAFAFHSSQLGAVGPALRQLLGEVAVVPAAVDMMSASDGRISRTLSADGLWATLSGPVDFQATLARLATQGPRRYVDIGPSGTLATFAKYGLPKSAGAEIVATVTPYGDARAAVDRLAPVASIPLADRRAA